MEDKIKRPSRKTSFLTKNIILLSLISLFTDIASEMLYPVMPLYLKNIGYSVIAIGFLEGFADALSGLTKGLFGYISDKHSNRPLFIRIGYGVSAISKPIMGITSQIGVIFSARMFDRFGKGIRTAPRDAILSVESTVENRGKVFGFHRSMDTLGATIGPIFALIFLFHFPSSYRNLFFIAFIPGLLALSLTVFVRNRRAKANDSITKEENEEKLSFKSFLKNAPSSYKKILFGLLLLALLNSSDMFLLLRAKDLGMNDTLVIGSYILYNLVFTIFAFPLGYISDRLGFRKTFILGIIIFSIVYGAFARDLSINILLIIFAIYGIFAATYEAVAKAWLSTYLKSNEQGTGLGVYMSLNSLAFLLASIGTGVIWQKIGASFAFSLISISSIIILLYFTLIPLDNAGRLETKGAERLGCNARH